MNDFVNTYPHVPHRMDEATVARLRSTTVCDDQLQPDPAEAATHYGMEDGRCATPAEDAAFLAAVAIASIVLIALVSVFLGFREELADLARQLIPAATGR